MAAAAAGQGKVAEVEHRLQADDGGWELFAPLVTAIQKKLNIRINFDDKNK